jgi:probable phosphoglycerate mutase
MNQPELWLVRHGETPWSRSGQHTSHTDLELTAKGRDEAMAVGRALGGRQFDLVTSSPMRRARATAELAGYQPELDPDLHEWDYGDLEGLTTPEIREQYPGWTIWKGPWPGGEDDKAVGARVDRFVDRVRDLGTGQRAVAFAHGHVLRAVAARWTACPVDHGRLFTLGTATLSVLGWEHGQPAVRHWNVPSDLPSGPAEQAQGDGGGSGPKP